MRGIVAKQGAGSKRELIFEEVDEIEEIDEIKNDFFDILDFVDFIGSPDFFDFGVQTCYSFLNLLPF